MSALILPFLFAVTAAAVSEPSAWWRADFELEVRLDIAGYEPARLVTRDGNGVFDAAESDAASADFRGRARIQTPVFHFELEPYTVVPVEWFVSYAGVIWKVLAPADDWFRVGIWHNSAHNFSLKQFGGGTNLTALYVEFSQPDEVPDLFGETLRYRAHVAGLAFIGNSQFGDPHILMSGTRVRIASLQNTIWQAEAGLSGLHKLGRASCVAVTRSHEYVPDSATFTCNAGVSFDYPPFEPWGERLLFGPYLQIGVNFNRQVEFGWTEYVAGLTATVILFDEIDR